MTVQWQEISVVPDPAALFPSGVCSICFDDGYLTQYTAGKMLLDQYGYRGSLALIRDAIGLPTEMTLTQIQSLQNDLGWEAGLHADTGAVHAATDVGVPLSQVETDLRHEKAYFHANGLIADSLFAYPSGLWTPASVQLIRQYCHAGRLDFFRTQETFPPANPWKLRACGAIGSFAGGHSAATVNASIDAAAANRSWLILIFHKIVSGTAASATECSAADMTTIMTHLAASGMAVRPVGEVMALARAQ